MRTTNDRVVVLDNASNDVVVLLPLNQYESLLTNGKTGAPTLNPQRGAPSAALLEELGGVDELAAAADEVEDEIDEEEVFASHLPASQNHSAPFTPQGSSQPSSPVVPKATESGQPPKQNLEFSNDWAKNNSASPSEDLSNLPEEPEEQFYLEPVE